MSHWMQTSFSTENRDTDKMFTDIFKLGGFIKLEETTCTVMYNSDANTQLQQIINPASEEEPTS